MRRPEAPSVAGDPPSEHSTGDRGVGTSRPRPGAPARPQHGGYPPPAGFASITGDLADGTNLPLGRPLAARPHSQAPALTPDERPTRTTKRGCRRPADRLRG